jgi:hypothetical protein
MEKATFQLGYRIPAETKKEFEKVCRDNLQQPALVINKLMLDYVKKGAEKNG